MSTRQSIKYELAPGSYTGFHLFTDATDHHREYVHLELRGVMFEADFDGNRGNVTVSIPTAWASKLGLID